MGTVSAQGSTVWVLMRRRNSSLRRSIALVVRADFHCDGSRRVKAVGWVSGHPEITPPSNFHHFRDTIARRSQ
jgi:hypothetical protein